MSEVEIFRGEFAKNSSITASFIDGKEIGRSFDAIHVVIEGVDARVEFYASPDEAIAITWALQKCLYYFLTTFPPYCEWRGEGSSTPGGWNPDEPPEIPVVEEL